MLSKEEYKKIFDILAEKYPKLFIVNSPLLLKLGIFDEIPADLKADLGKTKLRKFFRIYCTKEIYNKLHVLGADRYDLAGNRCGVVTKEHMELREEGIQNQKKKAKERKIHAANRSDNIESNAIDQKEDVKEKIESIHKKPKLGLKL